MSQVRPLLSPLLVGRDELLGLAERRIAEVGRGRGQLLMLAGEAGIGKTRLLQAALRRAAAEGFRVAKGDLSPHDRQVPLASISDLARTMRGVAAFDDLGSRLLALRTSADADALGARRSLVHEIADLIADAVDRPTVLAFDDLQWADELSLEVIGELARLARDRPLLLLAAYRLDELPVASIHREWRSRLLSQRLAEEARLRPLDRDETALVVTLILETGLPAPREVVNAVYERTDGIPLHIEELLAALDDRARTDGRAIREAQVPDTIEDAVLARYARLSEDARMVARAGAVIGRCFVPDMLAGCLDRPVADLDVPLAELVEQSFLYPFDFLDRGYYDFRHQLLRDALYATVPPAELRRLHARAGEFGSQLVGTSDVHASVHFERAGLRALAYRTAMKGAREASAVCSRREAFELYERAAANAPDSLPADELAALYEGYCEAALAIDNVPVIEETATLARRYFIEAGRPLDAASMLATLAANARRDVRSAEERGALLLAADAEVTALPETPDRNLVLSDLRVMQGLLEFDAGRHAAASARFDEARTLLHAAGITDSGDVDYIDATVDVFAGRVHEGLLAMLEVARRGREARQESTGVTAYRWAAAAAVRVMAYPIAEVGLREGLRYADEIEQSYCRHVMAATAAHLAWAAGRWDEAVTAAAIEIVEHGSRRGTLGSRDALGFVAFGRGDVERARTLLGESLAIGRPADEVDLVLPAMWGLAETALIAGEPEVALRWCEEALALVEATDERVLLVPFVVTGVRAALSARRPDVAARWLAHLSTLLEAWDELARPALDHADGLLRTSAGSTIAARTALEAAVAGWEALGRTWEALWARIDLAACLLRANREAEAMTGLREVRTRAEALEADPLVRRADELLAVARSRGAEEEPWRPLTAREFEVARLVADGLTNGEIGAKLGLSTRTVGAHLEHILAKLDFTRRAEVAAWVASMAGPVPTGVGG
jgi:DNA-binding CsgD family transcriptional regulator